MHQLLRRIGINGGVAAFILGILGLVLADLAASTVLMPVGTRSQADPAGPEAEHAKAAAAEMRSSIPLTMAIWGFIFIAGVETVRHLVRGRRTTPVTVQPPAPPDETEKLLEELLAQAEAKAAGRTESQNAQEQTAPATK